MDIHQIALTTKVAEEISQFSRRLNQSYQTMIDGGVFEGTMVRPHLIVSEALECRNGIVCPLLYSYVEQSPSEMDIPFLKIIGDGIKQIISIAEDVAKRLKFALCKIRPKSYVNRFSIAPDRLFAYDYFERLASRFRSLENVRERVIEKCCTAIRRLFEWLRCQLRILEAQFVEDPFRKIVLTPYAQSVVEMADRRMGLIILKAGPRVGSMPFHILPTSTKVWEVLRLLLERSDNDGYVALPPNYASSFHHTDSGNDTIDDDYAHLAMHIVPGIVPGRYRLELAEKPRLLRNR